MAKLTRAVRGSDYSPTTALSEEKDKLVTENWKDRKKLLYTLIAFHVKKRLSSQSRTSSPKGNHCSPESNVPRSNLISKAYYPSHTKQIKKHGYIFYGMVYRQKHYFFKSLGFKITF